MNNLIFGLIKFMIGLLVCFIITFGTKVMLVYMNVHELFYIFMDFMEYIFTMSAITTFVLIVILSLIHRYVHVKSIEQFIKEGGQVIKR